VASPELLAKSEHYLSVGYQKLLTFEHKNGGLRLVGQVASRSCGSAPTACTSSAT